MVVYAILVSVLILGAVTGRYDDDLYRLTAFMAFAGHLFVSLAVLPRLPYRWDIMQFHRGALDIAAGVPFTGSATIGTFAGFQGLLYTLFAPRPATLSVINGLLAVLVAIPAAYIAKNLYSETDSKAPTVIVGVMFFPLQFLFLSIPMRDTLGVLIFFTLLAVCLAARRRYVNGLAGIPLWGLLYLLRNELALVVLLGVFAAAGITILRRIRAGVSLPALTAIFGFIGSIGLGLFTEFVLSFERANAQLQGRADGGAAYLEGMSYQSWFDFLLAAPARGLYFQFTPFPLHVQSVFHLLAFCTSVLVILLFVSAARSLYECEYDETVAVFLLIVYAAGVVGYGTINSNFGTNVRHRIPFDFLLIIFASPVLQRWWSRAGEWIGVGPCQSSHENEDENEAQELHRSSHG